MYTHTCLVTGNQFRSNNRDAVFCPSISNSIKALVHKDPQLKKEIVSEIVSDSEAVSELVTAIMSTKCTEVGLNSPGTISEMFSRHRI